MLPIPVLVLLLTADPIGGGQPVFDRSPAELSVVGIHEAEGFVFSAARVGLPAEATDLRKEGAKMKANLLALRGFLEERIRERQEILSLPPAVARAASDVLLTCALTATVMQGVEQVHTAIDGEGAICVLALPKASVDAMVVSIGDPLTCLSARADSCSLPEAMVFLELAPPSSEFHTLAAASVRSRMAAAYGMGITAMIDANWSPSDISAVRASVAGWVGSITAATAPGEHPLVGVAPLGEGVLDKLTSEELLALSAVRVFDQAVQQAAVKRLRDAGWARSASMLEAHPVQVAAFAPLPSLAPAPTVDRQWLSKVATTPVVTLALVTGGTVTLPLAGGEPSAEVLRAREEFAKPGSEALNATIGLLQENLATAPSTHGMITLGAALLAGNEFQVALPVCRAAYRADPTHEHAGVNLLRVLRALELRDQAAELVVKLRASIEATTDDWGRTQLDRIEEWSLGK